MNELEGRQTCDELVQGIEQAWALSAGPERARQVNGIVETLRSQKRLRLYLPAERAVQLGRLVTAHLDGLSERELIDMIDVLSTFDFGHSSVADFIVEMVMARFRDLEIGLEVPEAAGALPPDELRQLVVRLSSILDTEEDSERREAAAMWLGYWPLPESVPALRRALRSQSFQVRYHALGSLNAQPAPMTEEDLSFLLDDLVAGRVLPPDDFEGVHYLEMLESVLCKSAPPSCGDFLQRVRAGRTPTFGGVLFPDWTGHFLARGYPERVIREIDAWLANRHAEVRLEGIHLAAALPLEMARERLRRAVEGDPDLGNVEEARGYLRNLSSQGGGEDAEEPERE